MTVGQLRTWLPGFHPSPGADPDLGWHHGADLADEEIGRLLATWPFRLPTEAEWEYAARAGTTTLTYRGDGVPDQQDLLMWYDDEAANARNANGFGLVGVGSQSELCADTYRDGYDGAPVDGTARTGEGPRVVRGGACRFSPWQGCCEWIMMFSAERAYQQFEAAIRPALSL